MLFLDIIDDGSRWEPNCHSKWKFFFVLLFVPIITWGISHENQNWLVSNAANPPGTPYFFLLRTRSFKTQMRPINEHWAHCHIQTPSRYDWKRHEILINKRPVNEVITDSFCFEPEISKAKWLQVGGSSYFFLLRTGHIHSQMRINFAAPCAKVSSGICGRRRSRSPEHSRCLISAFAIR